MGKGKASTAAAAKAATSNSKKAVVAKKKKTPSVKAPPPSSSSRKGSGRQQHKQGALDSVFGPLVSKNKNSNKKQHQAPSRPRSNSRSDRSNSGSNSRRNGRGPQDNRDEPITYRPNYNNNNAVEGGVVKKKHSKQKNTKRDGGDTNNTQSDFKRQKRHSAPPAPPPSSVKLPTKPAPPASTVPWMMQSSQKTAAATPTATEKRRNTTSTPDAAAAAAAPYCCPAILTALDDELERFGVYVMLNDTECQARRNLVEQFEQTARELFAAKQRQQQQLRSSNNNNNSQHTRFLFSGGSAARTTSTTTPANKMAASLSSSSSSSNKTKKIECKVFGSFATLAVCTFQSDVDLALWGVVPVTAAVEPCSIPSRGAQRNNTNKAPNNTAATMTTEGLAIGEPGAKKMSKQELLRLKWKDALAATDDANANCATDERSGLQSSSEEVDDTKTSAALAAALSAANAVTSAKAEPATVTVTVEEEACSSIPEGERNNADEALLLFVIDRVGDPSLAAEAAVDASETLCITTSSDNALDGDAAAAATAPNSTARTDGCSKDTAIEVDYEKDANSVNPADSTDDDDDDADPMESFPTMQNRIHSALSAKRSYAVMNTASAKDDDDGYVTAESSDTDDESVFDEEGSASSDLEVSFFSGQPAMPPTNAPAGPQGWVRTEVVSALASFSNKLRKSKLTKTVYLIKGARVPIIKVDTFFGFEADIAVGGHNGTDTSSYAATQVEMYQR